MRFAAVVLVLAVAGCAGPGPRAPVGPELVAVIPGPTGHVGAVVVQSGGSEQVLDQAYAARRVMADGSAAPATVTLGARSPGNSAGRSPRFPAGRRPSRSTSSRAGTSSPPASRQEMEKVFAELKRRPAPDIVVIGHTDTVGNLAFNDKLSLARAERMRELMIGLGIAPRAHPGRRARQARAPRAHGRQRLRAAQPPRGDQRPLGALRPVPADREQGQVVGGLRRSRETPHVVANPRSRSRARRRRRPATPSEVRSRSDPKNSFAGFIASVAPSESASSHSPRTSVRRVEG